MSVNNEIIEVVEVDSVLDKCPSEFIVANDSYVISRSNRLEFITYFCKSCVNNLHCDSRCKDCESALRSYERVERN